MSATNTGETPPLLGLMIVAWGVSGVIGLLANAIIRLLPLALEPVRAGMMTPGLWILAVLWWVFMAYTEGYRGFHRAFAPRVVARSLWLAQHPRGSLIVAAPLFAMGLIHATRKRKIVSWTILIGVVLLIVMIRGLAQPWRGLIDSGVILGLALGGLSILGHLMLALLGRPPTIAVDVPEPAEVRSPR